jgi:hypothetical protein
MELDTGTNSLDVDMLAAVLALVAHSHIVVAECKREGAAKYRSLPGGFGDIDVAILEWIAAEGRSVGRRLLRH